MCPRISAKLTIAIIIDPHSKFKYALAPPAVIIVAPAKELISAPMRPNDIADAAPVLGIKVGSPI
jgi:hypothetical protein